MCSPVEHCTLLYPEILWYHGTAESSGGLSWKGPSRSENHRMAWIGTILQGHRITESQHGWGKKGLRSPPRPTPCPWADPIPPSVAQGPFMALAAQRAPVLLWAAMLGPHHPLGEELPSIQYAQQRKSEVLRYSAANWRNVFLPYQQCSPAAKLECS